MHVPAAGLIEILSAGSGGIGNGGRHGDADAQHLTAGGRARGLPIPDDDARGSGSHQVQGRAVIDHATGNNGDIQFGDKGFQVQRLAVAGHPLGRHDGAVDDQQVDARGNQMRSEQLRVLRTHPHRGGYPGPAHLGDGRGQ
ncbi:Uncharacterised protein [Mycobacteroides abscessus subsp. massiliense]|nr:Uncharacterised protein [Mycobacteroides abscessus subsp. massiliense]